MFALIDSRVLRPLPFPAPQEIVSFWGGLDLAVGRDVAAWYRTAPSLPHVATFDAGGAELATATGAQRVVAAMVSGDFFTILGVRPIAGRWLSAGDEGIAPVRSQRAARADADARSPSVAVVSERLATARFGRAADAVGRRIELDGRIYDVVGVAPHRLSFPEGADVWIPRMAPDLGWGMFDWTDVAGQPASDGLLGRLAPGRSFEQASAEIRTLHDRQVRLARGLGSEILYSPARISRLGDVLVGDVASGMWLLGVAVGFVVLVGGANVASLSASMTVARSAELAVRSACGAPRLSLVASVLAPIVVLVAGGALLGVLLTYWSAEFLDRAIAWGPRTRPLAISLPVAAGAGLTAAAMGVAASLVAHWAVRRQSLYRVLATGQGTTSGRLLPFATTMVILQVAVSVVLVGGAGAALTGLRTVLAPPTGVALAGATVADLIYRRDTAGDAIRASLDALEPAVRALPSVRHVGFVNPLPLGPDGYGTYVYAGSVEAIVPFRSVAGVSFRALGVAILAGQDFASPGARGGTVIVSESLAQAGWGGAAAALGQHLRVEQGEELREVIGVAADVVHPTAPVFGPDRRWQMYVPAADPLWDSVGSRWTLVARGDGSVAPPGSLIADRVRATSAGVRVHRVQAYDDVLWERAERERVQAALFASLSMIVLALTGLGAFGLSLYATSLRQREIGMRMMVGARTRHIVGIVLRPLLRAALGGACLGSGATWVAARVAAASSSAFAPADTETVALAFLLVVGTAVAAGAAAARAFSRYPPAILLRYE